jgi:hypothetical protein
MTGGLLSRQIAGRCMRDVGVTSRSQFNFSTEKTRSLRKKFACPSHASSPIPLLSFSSLHWIVQTLIGAIYCRASYLGSRLCSTPSILPRLFSDTPRSVFIPFHARRQRWACMITHRRAGKTVGCIRDMIDKAVRKPGGRFAYVAPLRNQAKTVACDYLKDFARRSSPSPRTRLNSTSRFAPLVQQPSFPESPPRWAATLRPVPAICRESSLRHCFSFMEFSQGEVC